MIKVKTVILVLVVNLAIFSINLIVLCQVKPDRVPPSVAFKVDEIDLIPEGITYDPQTKQFFLSSKFKEKIIAVDTNDNHYDFIESGQDGMLGSLGLKVDAKRRRLWAVSNKRNEGRQESAVHIYDIDNKTLIKKFYTPRSERFLLNDLSIMEEGGAYITDTQGGNLFVVPPDLSGLKSFMQDSLFVDLNGLVLSPDEKLLYVESDRNGILIIDLQNNTIEPIENIMSVDTGGLDGIVLYDNTIIGVANARYEFTYIIRFWLSANGKEVTAASIIDSDNPLFITPTTCTVVDDKLYLLAATCLGVCLTNQMHRRDLLHEPLVLEYRLGD